MSGDIIAGVVTPHTPRMAVETRAPDCLRGVIAGRVKAEMGGRPIATMLGTLDDADGTAYAGETYGDYGQSSGSGNIGLAVRPMS